MEQGADSYRRFLDGDESGFDEIIRLYHDGLIFFLNRYVHCFAAAEDLAADTFMELIVHKNRYSFRSSFKTYLFAIARHKAMDYLRHESHLAPMTAEEALCDAADTASVERAVLAEEQKREIERLLATLTQDYATYLHLSLFEEMTNDEIAVILHKTKRQMTNLAYRAKQALKEAMRKEGISS